MNAMLKSPELRGRKLPAVGAHLRHHIVRGRFQPGQRLPSSRDIARDLKVSYMSVQRAFGVVPRDGFVAGKSVRGTFRVERPPHLFRYGVVFQSDPSGGE